MSSLQVVILSLRIGACCAQNVAKMGGVHVCMGSYFLFRFSSPNHQSPYHIILYPYLTQIESFSNLSE